MILTDEGGTYQVDYNCPKVRCRKCPNLTRAQRVVFIIVSTVALTTLYFLFLSGTLNLNLITATNITSILNSTAANNSTQILTTAANSTEILTASTSAACPILLPILYTMTVFCIGTSVFLYIYSMFKTNLLFLTKSMCRSYCFLMLTILSIIISAVVSFQCNLQLTYMAVLFCASLLILISTLAIFLTLQKKEDIKQAKEVFLELPCDSNL